MLDIEINKSKEKAMVYIMNTYNESIPSDFYYEVLENGYKDFGFDLKILEKALKESYERSK